MRVHLHFMPIQKLDKCLPGKLQGADRARHYLAIVDFWRKQKKSERPREKERDVACGETGGKRREKISRWSDDEEERRKVEPY